MGIDVAVDGFVRSLEFSGLTYFSKFVHVVFEPLVLVFLSLVIGVWFWFRGMKRQGVFFVAGIFVAGVLIKILKEIFQRVRPLDSLVQDVGFSFPSGHATIVVVFLGLLVYFLVGKKDRLLGFSAVAFVAVLIGFTRLYLGVHWFSDVVGGLVLGSVVLVATVFFYEKKWF